MAGLRDTFDALPDTYGVMFWFKKNMSSFFGEWPRGSGGLQSAVRAARDSRHGAALSEFLNKLDAHWYDQSIDPFVGCRFSLLLTDIQVLRPAPRGVRLYLRGRASLDVRPVYVYLDDGQAAEFEAAYRGQDVVVEADEIEFKPGQGGAVRNILSWRLA